MAKNLTHDNIKYPVLLQAMQKEGVGCWDIANRIGVNADVVAKKLAGRYSLSVWEKVKIKQLVHSTLSIEALFEI